jgi:tRNA-binding protein
MTHNKNVDMIDFSYFEKIDVRVGVICSVENAERCQKSAYKLEIDFGPEIGIKKSIAQLTNYSKEQLVNKQILGIVNLKPRQIGRHISEVLTLGVPTSNEGTSLVVPDMRAIVGGKLF